MKHPFLLWKRGKVWYYKLPEINHYLSTGQSTRRAAKNYFVEIINYKRASVPCYYTFRRYSQPYTEQASTLMTAVLRCTRGRGKSCTRREVPAFSYTNALISIHSSFLAFSGEAEIQGPCHPLLPIAASTSPIPPKRAECL